MRVSSRTTVATMDQKVASAAHFALILRGQHECTRSLDSRMHDILTRAQFVGGGREGASVNHTLLSRVKVSTSLSTVAMDVNCPGT